MCGGGRGGVVVGPSNGGTVKRWLVKDAYDSEHGHVGDRYRCDPGGTWSRCGCVRAVTRRERRAEEEPLWYGERVTYLFRARSTLLKVGVSVGGMNLH